MSSDTGTGGIGNGPLSDASEGDMPPFPDGDPTDGDPTDGDPSDGGSGGVGALLRAARERKRLDLAHIAAETRIPTHHLQVIEAGEFETLPSRTYAIGFARTYARMVGLDEEEIADAVRAELSDEGERRRHGAGAMEPGDPAKLPSSGLAWFGALAAIVLVIGVIAFSTTYFGEGADLPELTRDDSAPAVPAAPAPAQQVAATTAPAPADPAGEVVFTATEDGVWVRFYERGGERLYEAQMDSGESFTVPSDAQEPLINTGRPDALAITIGGREVPRLAEGARTMGGEPVSARALIARGQGAGPAAN